MVQPPRVVIPNLGQENSISFIVQTFEIEEVRLLLNLLYSNTAVKLETKPYLQLADKLQEFRVATAAAITRYCGGIECLLATTSGPQRSNWLWIYLSQHNHCVFTYSSSNITVKPQDIAIPTSNITSNSDGRPVLLFYAQLDSERVVSANVLMRAVEVRKLLLGDD